MEFVVMFTMAFVSQHCLALGDNGETITHDWQSVLIDLIMVNHHFLLTLWKYSRKSHLPLQFSVTEMNLSSCVHTGLNSCVQLFFWKVNMNAQFYRSTTSHLEFLHPFLCLNYQEPAKELQTMKNSIKLLSSFMKKKIKKINLFPDYY